MNASTPSATPSPTSSASTVEVVATPEPPRANDRKPSKKGAATFAEYFLQLFAYVSATGDLAAWNELSDPDCKFCASVREGVESANDAGEHDVGGRIAATNVVAREVVQSSTYEVALDVDQDASHTVDALGATVEEFPGPKALRVTMIVRWADDAWSVRGVQVDPAR